MKMPVPHLNIRIVQRSKGSSAVAGANYQAEEKLFSEYDQKNKDHHRKQKEVVYTEIMLPTNAPPEYFDRATLWDSAEI
ncbi:MobA/MobL family protein [Floccifex sp.]|uniref:MobA/MobL family protein n=1 Tax=Floccifex sp. TaxID=2815810 RepID=UPI002A74C73A|nr:MobA/MobL family protein [Floccifex sp.]